MLPESVSDICEITLYSGPEAEADSPPQILIEIPHGATRLEHLDRAKSWIRAEHDPRNDLFFLANTDQGAPEYAQWLASHLTDPHLVPLPDNDPETAERVRKLVSSLKIVMIRALLPRTLVDVNRTWDGDTREAGLTGVVGPFITDPDDLQLLAEKHGQYLQKARQLYDLVCGSGGLGLNLHTYAPISLQPQADRHIADVMKEAYTTDAYHSYPVRPLVELITQPPGESALAPEALCQLVKNFYAEIGVKVCENDPFNLHPSTSAYEFARKYPGQTLLMEISRAELADPFDPFTVMYICPEKTARMTRPLARALLSFLLSGNTAA